jgi:tetrahydromethanopterin S-methyltransferase subunit D
MNKFISSAARAFAVATGAVLLASGASSTALAAALDCSGTGDSDTFIDASGKVRFGP